jgi:hypothetical protein
MLEIFEHPEHQIPLWTAAANGQPDWSHIFEGYSATVDWPSAAFWQELVTEYPEAVVLLSRRQSADAWWHSAHQTIFTMLTRHDGEESASPEILGWRDTVLAILARNGVDPTDETTSKEAYDRHIVAVREAVPAHRLVEWLSGDGWGPLCAALGVPQPEQPFPHVNTTQEFRAIFGLDT